MTAFPRQSRPRGVRFSGRVTTRTAPAISAPAAEPVQAGPEAQRRAGFSGISLLALPLAMLLLAGCRADPKPHTPPPGVPKSATLVVERSGSFGFPAPEIGTVYIYDETARRVIYKTAVNYRDNLIFYPAKDRIILNGNVVKEDRNLNEDHVHRLYFVKG